MGWGADNPPGGPLVAPRVRLVNALTGKKAPSKFMAALSEADNFVREVDGLRELQTRVQELEESERLARADADDAAETIGLLLAERDDLAEKLREGDEAHEITLSLLALANTQLRRMAATR